MTKDKSKSQSPRSQVGLSAAHLALAQQVAHVGSWELDLANLDNINSNPLRWSDETFRLLGYVPGEIEPSNDLFFRAVHPEDREKIRLAVARAIQNQIPYNIEHRVIWPDGTERVLHELSTIVYDDHGKPATMLGVVQDVTERRRLEFSQDMPELILRHIRDSVIATDLEGHIIFWNMGAAAIFGYSKEEMLGSPVKRLYPVSQLQNLRTQLQQILTGEDFRGEWQGVRKNGTSVWLHTYRTLIRNADGEPVGFLGVSKDITPMKLEQEAVRQSEQLYRAIGESVDYGVWSCDVTGRITHMSESFMKMLGLTAAQNLQDGWLNAIHPDERKDVAIARQKGLRSSERWDEKYRILGLDGLYHRVHTHAAPVFDDDGKLLSWAGLNLDIDKLA